MNVTRHVIQDLLPAYAAGDVHADTARLVDAWLERDPALRRELDALRGVDGALADAGEAGAATPTAEHELQALKRTRSALRLRSVLLGLAIFFSLLPFSVVVREDGARWLVLDHPGLVLIVGALAVAAWLGWFLLAAKLRVRSGV
jgi:anti-sigma factor RsiW